MKRITKIGIIISVIIVVIVLGVILTFMLAKEKTPITAEEFKTIMEEKGYVIGDATAQFEEYGYINKTYIAANKDYTYQIEFYEILDEEYARNFFSLNKKVFEDIKGNLATETNVSMKNYSIYTLSTERKYRVLSRIENTVIYVNVDDAYKDEVKGILEELGY